MEEAKRGKRRRQREARGGGKERQEEEAKRGKRRRQREARGGGKERQEEEAKGGKRRRQREARGGGKARQEEEAKRGKRRRQREARVGGKERQEGCLCLSAGEVKRKPSSLLARKIQFNAAFGGLLVVEIASLTPFSILAVGTETTNGGWN